MNTLRILTFLLFGLQFASANNSETFATANQAYNQGNFGEAIKNYEALIRRGEIRPEIYYNLGLAFEKSANPAKAILSLERSLLLDPSSRDAQARLENLTGVSSKWWERLPRIGSRMNVIIGTIVVWLFLFAAVAAWRVLAGTKALWRMLQILSVLIFAIAAANFYLRELPLGSPERAIVLKSETLRANFTANSPSILGLKPGQAVEITSVNGPWTECRLPDETRGWVATPSLERVIPHT